MFFLFIKFLLTSILCALPFVYPSVFRLHFSNSFLSRRNKHSKKNLSLVRGESHSVSLTTVAKQLTFVIPFLSHLVSRFQPSAFRVKPSNPFKYKYSSSPQEASLPTLSCWFICVWCLIAARGHRQARVIVTNLFYSLIFKDRVDNIQQ